MAATGCIEPIYIQDVSSSMTEWLPYHLERMTGFTPHDFPNQVLRRIGRMMEISVDNFRVQTRSYVDRPRPVYASTGAPPLHFTLPFPSFPLPPPFPFPSTPPPFPSPLLPLPPFPSDPVRAIYVALIPENLYTTQPYTQQNPLIDPHVPSLRPLQPQHCRLGYFKISMCQNWCRIYCRDHTLLTLLGMCLTLSINPLTLTLTNPPSQPQ